VCVREREREELFCDKSSDIKDIVVELFQFGLGCDLYKEATFTLTTFLFYPLVLFNYFIHHKIYVKLVFRFINILINYTIKTIKRLFIFYHSGSIYSSIFLFKNILVFKIYIDKDIY
jgi:hypothetical protein